MHNTPIIRLQLEQDSISIVHHLQAYHKEIEDAVIAQMDEAIKNFDFVGEIRKQATTAIQVAIADYFINAGKLIIEQAIAQRLDQLLRDAVS